MLKNDRLLRALSRQPVDMTPVWIMRQAGRYLPEYRAARKRAGSFLKLCQTPDLACEVTLQPLQRFALDAAILFSDILTVPAAMGLDLHFVDGEGPAFTKPVQNAHDIAQLCVPDPEQALAYVMDAVRLIKRELHDSVPLIGFAGSPWTVACYMLEGKGQANFPQAKKMLFRAPELLLALLDKIAAATTLYLNAQIAAGVDVVMLFDSWGGLLSYADYQTFSLHYMQRILQGLQRHRGDAKVPVIFFTKGGSAWLPLIADSGCDAISLDCTMSIGTAQQQVGHRVALQGNLDPSTLYAQPEKIIAEVQHLLADYGANPGHVFNLGHGIAPDMDPEHLGVLIDAVHQYSKPYHI